MSNKTEPRAVALAYLEAAGRKDFASFSNLLAPNVTFKGPSAALSGAAEVVATFERLTPILLRNELRKAFVDGNEVCLIYDFVTDTSVGPVPTMEWLKIHDGKIESVSLLTDHVRWPVVLEELKRRAQRKVG